MKLSRNLVIIIITLILLVALPATLYLVRQQQNLRPKATGGSVNFTVTDPQPGTKAFSQTFTIDLKIEAGTDALNKARATVIYDPANLTLVSFTPSSGSGTLGNVLQPDPAPSNSTSGSMIYEAVDFHDPNPSTGATQAPHGTINLGELVFRAGTSVVQTTIGISGALAGNADNPNMQTTFTPVTVTIGNQATQQSPTPASSVQQYPVMNNPTTSCQGTTPAVHLTWSNVGADSYQVSRWLADGNPISTSVQILTTTTQTTYTDTTAVTGKTYQYEAVAQWGNPVYQGGSTNSISIPVTIPNCSQPSAAGLCPSGATTCWVQGGNQCTDQAGADNWCTTHHTDVQTLGCDHTFGGPDGDGCTFGCPLNTTLPVCYLQHSNQCSNPAAGNLWCSGQHGTGSQCKTNNYGPYGDGCSQGATSSPSPTSQSCTTSNGDANKDGKVDLDDHQIWLDEFRGIHNAFEDILHSNKLADFNCNGTVDIFVDSGFSDFIIWKRSYAP